MKKLLFETHFDLQTLYIYQMVFFSVNKQQYELSWQLVSKVEWKLHLRYETLSKQGFKLKYILLDDDVTFSTEWRLITDSTTR